LTSLIHLCHDSVAGGLFGFEVCVPWLLYTCHDSVMTHSYVPWLIHAYMQELIHTAHDAFICTTHLYVPWLSSCLSLSNVTWHIRLRHGTCDMILQWHIWMSHAQRCILVCEWVMARTIVTCYIWYDSTMAHMNESCSQVYLHTHTHSNMILHTQTHIFEYDSTTAHVNESCPEVYLGLWVSHSTHNCDMVHIIWVRHGTYDTILPRHMWMSHALRCI